MNEKHPESRLLDLIREPSGRSARGGEPGAVRGGVRRLSSAFGSLRVSLVGRLAGIEPLKGIQAVLVLLLIASWGLLIFVWTEKGEHRKSPAPEEGALMLDDEVLLRRLSYYLRMAGTRGLFGQPPAVKEEPKGPTVRERAAGLTLLGFMESGGETQAVLMDRKAGITYYLKKGDSIRGLSVESAGGGKVVLSDGEDSVTLRL